MKLLLFFFGLIQALPAADPKADMIVPREGASTITGRAASGVVDFAVNVYQCSNIVAPCKKRLDTDTDPILQFGKCDKGTDGKSACVAADNTFTIKFDSKLGAEQVIQLQALDEKGNAVGDPIPVCVTSSVFDWGRARAYFSGGTVIAKSAQDFASPSIYLGLNVDYSWLQSNWHKDHTSGGHGLNTFFEARLTQVPLAGSSIPELNIGANSILQSSQSGIVQAGAYLPYYFHDTRWQFRRNDYALFLGPLAKGGFQTVRAGNIDGLTSDQAKAAQIDGKDVYRFVAGGVRIGHFRLPKGQGSSPELLSYIDVTTGRWDNLRTPRPGITPVGGAGFQYPLRFDAEGRHKVPYGPFFVGFGLNVGSGADDLRFLFGTRFDIGQLLSSITPLIK
jgi:hypothetical protein